MEPLLTTNAVILCSHGGKVSPIPSQSVVFAQGAPVLCGTDLLGAPIAGCPVVPSPTTKPCTTVAAVTPPSWSLKVMVVGRPAYVASLVGVTDGVPPGGLTVVYPGQTVAFG